MNICQICLVLRGCPLITSYNKEGQQKMIYDDEKGGGFSQKVIFDDKGGRVSPDPP